MNTRFFLREEAFNILAFATSQIQRRHAGSVNGQDKLLQTRARPFVVELHVIPTFQADRMRVG